MNRADLRHSDLRAVAPIAGVAVLAVAAAIPFWPARAVVALPLALALPGYCLLRALPDTGRQLDTATRLGACFVLSVASYALLGLMLYAAGIELSEASVLAAVTAEVTIATAAAMAARRPRAAQAPAPARRPAIGASAGLLAAALIALIAIPVGAHGLFPATAPSSYAQLYLADGSLARARVVRNLRSDAVNVDVGAQNHTGVARRYTLMRRVDAGRAEPAAAFTLADGDAWRGPVSVAVPRSPCAHRVQVLLRDESRRRIVGAVHVWAQRGRSSSCRDIP